MSVLRKLPCTKDLCLVSREELLKPAVMAEALGETREAVGALPDWRNSIFYVLSINMPSFSFGLETAHARINSYSLSFDAKKKIFFLSMLTMLKVSGKKKIATLSC